MFGPLSNSMVALEVGRSRTGRQAGLAAQMVIKPVLDVDTALDPEMLA